MPWELFERLDRILKGSRPSDLIYWTRFFLGISAGISCAILRVDVVGTVIGLFFYLLSYLLFRYVLKIGLDGVGKFKSYTMGLLPYLLAWITFWTLFHTYLM